MYCVIIQSAVEGGNHADRITLHLTELIVFPAGQISLRSGILFLSLCFAFELISGILAGHITSTTNDDKQLKKSSLHLISLTTFTHAFISRLCSSESGSGRVAGGAEEVAGGAARFEVIPESSQRTDAAVGEPDPVPQITAEPKPRSPDSHTGCVNPV